MKHEVAIALGGPVMRRRRLPHVGRAAVLNQPILQNEAKPTQPRGSGERKSLTWKEGYED